MTQPQIMRSIHLKHRSGVLAGPPFSLPPIGETFDTLAVSCLNIQISLCFLATSASVLDIIPSSNSFSAFLYSSSILMSIRMLLWTFSPPWSAKPRGTAFVYLLILLFCFSQGIYAIIVATPLTSQ